MKIAVIIWGLYSEGGAQREAIYLARELKKAGNDVTIYTLFYHPENCYKELLNGQEVKFLFRCDNPDFENKVLFGNDFIRKNRILNFLILTLRSNKLCKELANLIDSETEILNPHDKCYKISYFFKKYNKDIPSVWMANDLPSLMWNIEKFEIKKISFLNKLIRFLIDLYEKKFIKKQDRIIVLDKLNKSAVQKYFDREAYVIRSGLDMGYFKRKRPANSFPSLEKRKPVKILMVGILSPYRRFEDGIMSLKYLKEEGYNVILDIIGNYESNKEYKKKLDRIVKDNNLNGIVHFLGRVSEEGLLENYFSHNIFLFPNHMQTWGLAVFEAMACGLPVIVSKTSGASEVLREGENALLVPPKDPKKIAEKVKMLIDNPALYEKISKNSITFVKNNISWQKYSEEMLSMFKDLIKND